MTTGTGASLIFPDVCSDIELAYKGKNGFGGHVAEIYAYRLVLPRRERQIGAHEFTDHDAREAAENLAKLCQAFLLMHPDAVFSIDDREPRLFERVNLNDSPFPPFSHRIHLRVEPEHVDDPKVCVLLSWKIGTINQHFRVVVDGTYVTVEQRRDDRLGIAYWHPYDSARGIDEDKLIGAALGAIVKGEVSGTLERSYQNGIITIEIPGAFEDED